MNTMPPSSDSPDTPDFNGFGSFRRKRPSRDADVPAPRRPFRRLPHDEFPDASSSDRGGASDVRDDTADAPSPYRRPFRKPFNKKPFGKKPFVKKPFGKKSFGHGKTRTDGTSFRDFAETIDDGEVPPPRLDRSFKNPGNRFREDGRDTPRPHNPFGKKPSGKFRLPFKKRRFGGDDFSPAAPLALRRPYGAPGEASLEDGTSAPVPSSPRKPFGRKPFGKKPFGKGKPFGKKSFGKKPFAKGKPYGKQPFGKKAFGKKKFGSQSAKRRSPRG